MNNIKVCLDLQPFFSKPKPETAAQISKRIGRFSKQLNPDDIRAFARDISLDGYTFCPATFKDGKRNKENFEQQQMFPMDFDNKDPNKAISFEDIKARADRYGLQMLFAYETLSSEKKNKFRAVFLNDLPITDRIVAEAMSKALGTIFPEADQSCCKDVSRMYYGGKKVLYNGGDDELQTINAEAVFRNLTHCLKERYKPNHYKEQIARFSKETGIGLNGSGLLDVIVTDDPTELTGATLSDQNGKNSPSPIIYSLNRIANGEIFPIKYYRINTVNDNSTRESSVVKRPRKNHKDYRSSTMKDIERKCQLFREFESGQIKLKHDELFGIATNLIRVDTGSRRFKEILSENAHFYGSKCDKWTHDLAYMEQLDYHPQSCGGFCPHRKNCDHGVNILSTVALKRGTMERIPCYAEQFDSVEAVGEDVYQAIKAAYKTTGTMMHIIKAMTAIGKSTAFLNLMAANPSARFLIAAPTNILKNELYDKAVKLGINVMKTPSLEAIKNKIQAEVWNHIQQLYQIGQYRSVHPYICEILKKHDIPCLKKYMDEREKLKTYDGSVITTHRYLLNRGEKRLREFDTVIIDEDIILKSIISNQGKITIADLEKLLDEATNVQLIKKITKILKLAETKSCIKVGAFEWDCDEDDHNEISTPFDIPSFCLTKKFYICRASKESNSEQETVVFIKPATFYKDIKYIMVSATVDEDICCKYFSGKDNVNFYECGKAKYEGSLFQYPGRSMSRTSIDNSPDIIQRLMKRFSINAKYVITHKQYEIGDLWFGNTEGCNFMEGKDILVIGTPYHAEFLYKLTAFTMGLPFDKDAEMKAQLVTHNGYRFRFTTYDDENLRAIHFWMIESDLEQAVGRARLLRCNCNVHLFSNFPIEQANMMNDFDYNDRADDNSTVKGERKEPV